MSFKMNSLYLTDGYKVGHKRMLAEGTTRLYGTWIPRSLKHAPSEIKKVVSFGQQMVMKWLHDEFRNNFFHTEYIEILKAAHAQAEDKGQLTNAGALQDRIDELKNAVCGSFKQDMEDYLGQPYDVSHFEDLWDLGYLPIEVKALPEGIETLPNIPHMTFVNTVDGFAWLTLYLETIISSLAWKPATSATIALQYRRNVTEWVNKTDPGNAFLIDFLCHDFSARGLSPWDMISSGLGHATSFRGSDTLAVIPAARYFYGEKLVVTNSVNASEHSVSTTKIFTVGEKQMIIDWLKEFPTGILSIVADTFDLWKLLVEYLADPEVKELIVAREGKLVIRPDSGDPVDIICGAGEIENKNFNLVNLDHITEQVKRNGFVDYRQGNDLWRITLAEDGESLLIDESPAHKGVIEILWDIFGGTVNEQGYKVLDQHIGAIYGDSITLDRQVSIYSRLAEKGFAATNVVLGVGSFTYQYNTRDTFGFAAKGAWFESNGKPFDIYKDPITDDGTKKSLKGLQQVFVNEDGEYEVKSECTWEEEKEGVLQTIYKDGEFHNQITLQQIREKL